MMPVRLQRKRTLGWRTPPGAIYIGRPTPYGNSYNIDAPHPVHGWPMSAAEAVALFERDLLALIEINDYATSLRLDALQGCDLLCWCKEGAPCHGDIWLREANNGRRRSR